MDFQRLNTPPGQVSASEILVEALENVQTKGIERVVVMCFDSCGQPVGWLSNVGDAIQRLGMVEMMKASMIDGD